MAGYFYINLGYDSPVRYDEAKFMEYDTDVYDSLTSYFLDVLRKLPVHGEYVVVDEEGRPDLLSHRIYGSTQYWWILLVYNNLVSPFDVQSGMTIRYPSIDDLEALFFKLAALQRGKTL